jgi:rod shape-determining protein MreD
MRTVGVMVIAAGIGVLLQTAVLQALSFDQPAPDLLLILCVYVGLHHHGAGGVLGAFLLGYLEDSVSGGPVGLNAFGMVTVYLFVYLTCRRLWVDNVISRIVLVFLAAVVKAFAVIALLAVFLRFEESWRGVLWTVATHGALSAFVAPPVFALLSVAYTPDEQES